MRFSDHLRGLNTTIEAAEPKARAALQAAFPACFTNQRGGVVDVDLSPLLVAASAFPAVAGDLSRFHAAMVIECGYRGEAWTATALHTSLTKFLPALAGKDGKAKV